jgi:hypothetical protein
LFGLPEPSIGVVGVIIVGQIISTGAEREWDDDVDDDDFESSFVGKSEIIFDGELFIDLVISSG